MKSGPNISDENKIRKMLKAGAEPAGISAILNIKLDSIMMYTEQGRKESLEKREIAAVKQKKIARELRMAKAKAEAQAEIEEEEDKKMVAKVKSDEKKRIRDEKEKAK